MKPASLPTVVGKIPHDNDRLANDLAKELLDSPSLARMYGMSPAALSALMEYPEFEQKVLSARKKWMDTENTPERIRKKVDLMLEEMLPFLWERVTSPEASASIVSEITKLLRSLSTIAHNESANHAAANTFSLTVNVGGREEVVITPADSKES